MFLLRIGQTEKSRELWEKYRQISKQEGGEDVNTGRNRKMWEAYMDEQ